MEKLHAANVKPIGFSTITRRPTWGAWSAHLDAATNAAPVVSGCTTALGSIAGVSSHAGSWTGDCVSSNRPQARYARYYTFELVGAGELATAADLTIELVTSQDAYLFLMKGAGTNGSVVASNDDSRDDDLGYRNSRITYQASAGTYTVEATTFNSRVRGNFTLRIDAALRQPSPPTNVKVVPGNGRLVVLWDPPASDGGSAVTGYQVSQEEVSGSSGSGGRSRRAVADPSRLVGADDRGYAILNLSNGTEYSITVKAVNANGEGAPATATGTPRGTTISVTGPNTLEVGANGNVGASATNIVSGTAYKVRLSIDDASKISFNGCDPQDGAEILDSLTATATVRGCAAGAAGVTALLVVQDAGGGYQTLASNTPHEVTVEPGTLPAVTVPTASFASDGVTIDTGFALPLDGFRYRLVLYKHLTSTTREVVSVHSPGFGHSTHAFFIDDQRDDTEEYFVGLRACRPGTTGTTDCESEQVSARVSSSSGVSVVISSLTSSSIEGGRSATFSVNVTNLAASQTYALKVRTANGGVLKFDGCGINGEDPKSFDPITNAVSYNRTGIVVFACVSDTKSDTVAAVLSVGGTEIASSDATVSTTPVPVPKNLRANGRSNGLTTGQASLRWDDTPGVTYRYQARFGAECFTTRTVQGTRPDGTSVDVEVTDGALCNTSSSSWVTPTTARDATNPVLSGLNIGNLYRIQVRQGTNGIFSEWSKDVFAYPTSAILTARVATIPVFGHMPEGDYTYVVCENTLPKSTVSSNTWVSDIKAGIETWETAVRWINGSDNIVTATPTTYIEGFCHLAKHKVWFTSSFNLLACGPTPTVQYLGYLLPPGSTTRTGTLGCMASTAFFAPGDDNPVRSSTIYLFKDYTSWNPGTPTATNVTCSYLHQFTMHEAGHAFGLGQSVNEHAKASASVMKSGVDKRFCEPQPYDVAAMMALYQSR
ncbi:MAG: fibronectin type III domain-containing protein [Chloroflexi bacterium]|nr:fibronectin type III domain-containing protein [Chloroflexota bacterium]